MMWIIGKDKILDLLGRLSDFEIYGPVAEDNVTLYKRPNGSEQQPDMNLDFLNSRKPPKEIFFPQTEKMFDLVMDGSKVIGVKEPEFPDDPILLFAVRPCDVRATNYMDTLFGGDYIDPYYVNKRERATIISFSCTQSGLSLQNCFCTSVGGSPSSTEGADMLWTDIGDRYLVESVTDKGQAILDAGGDLFAAAAQDDEKAADDAKKTAENAVGRKLNTEGITEALEASFNSDYWKELSQRCLGCGICTLLCPTCHCFDINDVSSRDNAWRERTWDSCQYPYYSIHASGHNPRPEKTQRQRNRIYHKFLYSEMNMDMLGCVGCGRCITNCPVNIDIIEVINNVKALANSGGDAE